MPNDVVVSVMVAIVGFVIGVAKGGLGSALGSVATPMLSLVMSAPQALGVSLPLLLIGDVFACWLHWRNWDWKVVRAMLPGTVIGVLIGSLLLGQLSATTIQHSIGIFTLAFCIYKVIERQVRQEISHYTAHRWHAPIFGMGTGFTSTVGNAGGPVFTMYLLMLRISPAVFGATSALYFAILNSIKVPGYLLANILQPRYLLDYLWVIPIIYAGAWVGRTYTHKIDMRTFETVMLVLLAAIALLLLFK